VKLARVIAVPAADLVLHVAALEPLVPEHAGDAAVVEPLSPRHVMVVHVLERRGPTVELQRTRSNASVESKKK
jgi:hypothetical protein